MGIAGIHAIPIIYMSILQGTFCDTGIPHNFYGENICSVHKYLQCLTSYALYFTKIEEYSNDKRYVRKLNDTNGEHITHLHVSDIVTFETDISDT